MTAIGLFTSWAMLAVSWPTAASFSLRPADLSGPAAAVLTNVAEMRLFHGSAASFPGPGIVARLGMDQVSAVPEPGVAMLLLGGLALLGGASLCRARQATHRRPG